MDRTGGAADDVRGTALSASLLWEDGRYPTCVLARCGFWGFFGGNFSWFCFMERLQGSPVSFPRMCELSFHVGWPGGMGMGGEGWIPSRKEELELEQHLEKLGAAGGAEGLPHRIPCWLSGQIQAVHSWEWERAGWECQMDGWWLQGTKQRD